MISDEVLSTEGFLDIFKITKSQEIIDKQFTKFEKSIKSKDDKSLDASNLSKGSIITKITIDRFKQFVMGKNIPSTAKLYFDQINSTKGDYSNRDSRIHNAIKDMYNHIKKNTTKSTYTNNILTYYTRLYDLLVGNTKLADMFSKSCKLHEKGNDIASIIYINYFALVYALEYTALVLRDYADDIANGLVDKVNEEVCTKNKAIVVGTAKNVVPLIVFYENMKDPKQYIDTLVKNDKKLNSSEESFLIDFEVSDKRLSNISQESILFSVLIYGTLSLIVTAAIVSGLRYIVYTMGCINIDISNSLIDQSHVLLTNIETLKAKLATLPEESKEYKKLSETIKKQEYYTEKLIDITSKIFKVEIKSIEDIREKDREDEDLILSSDDHDDSYGGGTTLDI